MKNAVRAGDGGPLKIGKKFVCDRCDARVIGCFFRDDKEWLCDDCRGMPFKRALGGVGAKVKPKVTQ